MVDRDEEYRRSKRHTQKKERERKGFEMRRDRLARLYIYIQVQGKQQGRNGNKKTKSVWSFELEKIRDGSKWGCEGLET